LSISNDLPNDFFVWSGRTELRRHFDARQVFGCSATLPLGLATLLGHCLNHPTPDKLAADVSAQILKAMSEL
jgi:hypothetical protein